MLSFVTYEVLKHPEVLLKLRAEVDEVLGDRPVSLEDLPRMPYTIAVLRETLRIWLPAPARSVFPTEPTTIGNGKYAVTPEDIIVVNTIQIQRDPEVWGDDVCFSVSSFLSARTLTAAPGAHIQTRANVRREVRGITSRLSPRQRSRLTTHFLYTRKMLGSHSGLARVLVS